MKLDFKNKSELMAVRFLYVWVMLFVALLLTYGFRRFVLEMVIIFLPFMRIILLYIRLPKPEGIITKIIQSLLILLPVLYILFVKVVSNLLGYAIAFRVYLLAGFLLILFHRFIFLSKRVFLLDRIVYPIFELIKKYYLDMIFFLFGFKLIFHLSTLVYETKISAIIDVFINWDFSFSQIWRYIGRWEGAWWIYLVYIVIAGIWYICSKRKQSGLTPLPHDCIAW